MVFFVQKSFLPNIPSVTTWSEAGVCHRGRCTRSQASDNVEEAEFTLSWSVQQGSKGRSREETSPVTLQQCPEGGRTLRLYTLKCFRYKTVSLLFLHFLRGHIHTQCHSYDRVCQRVNVMNHYMSWEILWVSFAEQIMK